MQMRNRQKGMTGIGWLIVLALIGFFTLLTLKMLPSYLEFYKVVSTLDSLTKETGMSEPSPQAIRRLIERRFDISYVNSISYRDVSIKPVGSNFQVTAKYEARKHLFANVDVIMNFSHMVKVPRI